MAIWRTTTTWGTTRYPITDENNNRNEAKTSNATKIYCKDAIKKSSAQVIFWWCCFWLFVLLWWRSRPRYTSKTKSQKQQHQKITQALKCCLSRDYIVFLTFLLLLSIYPVWLGKSGWGSSRHPQQVAAARFFFVNTKFYFFNMKFNFFNTKI